MRSCQLRGPAQGSWTNQRSGYHPLRPNPASLPRLPLQPDRDCPGSTCSAIQAFPVAHGGCRPSRQMHRSMSNKIQNTIASSLWLARPDIVDRDAQLRHQNWSPPAAFCHPKMRCRLRPTGSLIEHIKHRLPTRCLSPAMLAIWGLSSRLLEHFEKRSFGISC